LEAEEKKKKRNKRSKTTSTQGDGRNTTPTMLQNRVLYKTTSFKKNPKVNNKDGSKGNISKKLKKARKARLVVKSGNSKGGKGGIHRLGAALARELEACSRGEKTQ